MGSPLSIIVILPLLFLISQMRLVLTHPSPLTQPLCHDDEKLALLQFKESFILNKNASYGDPWAYPKVASWKLERNKSDCCRWDGVECDYHTGHVISLDLSSSLLYGSFNSSSSLFRLVHLQVLNLFNNDFNYSQIPSQVRNLFGLKELNLSWSVFSGAIPLEISQLSNLSSLDLSGNNHVFRPGNLSLRQLIGNLTYLEKLDLSWVSINSTMPDILTNLTSLMSLTLKSCGLFGELPPSLGNLTKLTHLALPYNGFEGKISLSLGNLTKLTYLDLSNNGFVGNIPFSLGNLEQLSNCHIANNQLSGEVHFGLMNETRLISLVLNGNQLTGPITLGPCSQLRFLDLANNQLLGQIPNSIFKLKNLEFLDLSYNLLNGTVEFVKFLKLKYLVSLHLSSNKLSLHIEVPTSNASLRQFEALGLSSCNLSKFPDFLRNQDKLKYLKLSSNNIHGQVPDWILNISKMSLQYFDLANNFLTGFGQQLIFLPWINLHILDLGGNLLQGPIPIPPISTLFFMATNNSLIGNIPEIFCNLSSLQVLDLSYNNLSGPFPLCLGNSITSLSILNLQRNELQGSIPEMWTSGTRLKMIILNQNKFQGPLPRSLANNMMLRFLDLSNNRFIDSFPFWLGHQPNLEVLILRSNNFYGLVGTPKTYFKFPNLRILDISHNDFTGQLPSVILENWKARKFDDMHNLMYMIEVLEITVDVGSNFSYSSQAYNFLMNLTNKGTNVLYTKVQEGLSAIDLSSNKFVGEIPKSIGNLRGCYLLNLSNNALIGQIPISLEKLYDLEALDLSQNQLVGEIPQQLTQLTFLEFFSVSHNNLSGPIPQGKQFNTFENESFQGNPGLCGSPLTKKCGNSIEPHTQSLVINESKESQDFGWKTVVIGYGFGFIFGGVIGHILFVRKQDWLMKTFRIRKSSRKGH